MLLKLLRLITRHSRFSVLLLVAHNVALNTKKIIYNNYIFCIKVRVKEGACLVFAIRRYFERINKDCRINKEGGLNPHPPVYAFAH